ncbi:MAG: SMP-30/gluconolactonase/LRE family protein [Planctomycetota bacterium]
MTPNTNVHERWGAFILAGLLTGCAVPQGELFLLTDPPIVWPPAPETPRIKLVGVLTGSADLKAAKSGGETFEDALRGPRPVIHFSGPHAVAVRARHLLAVADGGAGAVHVLDLDARSHLVVSGWNNERFGVPVGATWAGERLFVTDAERHEVIELSANGTYHRRFGADLLKRPVGIVYVASRDRLYVVDGGAHGIVVFDLSGQALTTLGQNGAAPGEFNYPSHIAWDGAGRLAVADAGNFRVQLLDLDGACLRVIGQKGDGAGDFSLPKGVAFDREGHLYVVDAHFENVQIFDAEGRLLLSFGQEGTARGEFALPAGLAIDQDDRIWVADSANHRVQVFAYVRNAR